MALNLEPWTLNLDYGSQRMDYGNQRMDYENQRMEYEDMDVKHERTVSSVPNVRIFYTRHLPPVLKNLLSLSE